MVSTGLDDVDRHSADFGHSWPTSTKLGRIRPEISGGVEQLRGEFGAEGYLNPTGYRTQRNFRAVCGIISILGGHVFCNVVRVLCRSLLGCRFFVKHRSHGVRLHLTVASAYSAFRLLRFGGGDSHESDSDTGACSRCTGWACFCPRLCASVVSLLRAMAGEEVPHGADGSAEPIVEAQRRGAACVARQRLRMRGCPVESARRGGSHPGCCAMQLAAPFFPCRVAQAAPLPCVCRASALFWSLMPWRRGPPRPWLAPNLGAPAGHASFFSVTESGPRELDVGSARFSAGSSGKSTLGRPEFGRHRTESRRHRPKCGYGVAKQDPRIADELKVAYSGCVAEMGQHGLTNWSPGTTNEASKAQRYT